MLKRTSSYLLLSVMAVFITAGIWLACGEKNKTKGGVPQEMDAVKNYAQDTGLMSALSQKASSIVASQTDSAIFLLEQVLQLNKKYDNATIEVKTLSLLASCYIRKGNYNKTLTILDTAFKKAQLISDPDLVAILYNASAIIYQQHGEYTKSIFNYFKGLNTLEEKGLSGSLRAAKMYNNLAGLFILLQEHDQALVFLKKARKILDQDNPEHKTTLAYVLCNSGIIKAATNEADAEGELRQALQLSEEINDPYIANKILINLSDISLLRRDYQQVDALLYRALGMARKTKNPISILLTDYGMGHSYLLRANYTKALSSLESAYNASISSGYNDALLTITKDLKEAYAGIGNYAKAYSLQEEYAALKDSIQHKEKKQTFDLLLQFQAAEKDGELARSQLEINNQQSRLKEKNIWIGIFTGGTILLATLFFTVLVNNRNKQRLQLAQLKNAEQHWEFERLTAAFDGEERERTRISRDIHDGVMSTLATIRMRIKRLEEDIPGLKERGDYTNTIQLFDKATTELRMTAHNLMPDLLLEDGLSKAIFYFAKSIEENTGIAVTVESFGDMPELSQNLSLFLYRAIQELIQNVIKHSGATQLHIQLTCHNEALNITVEDNGVGMKQNAFEGMGLKSLKSRVQLYNGEMNIISVPGEGTSVTLDFVHLA